MATTMENNVANKRCDQETGSPPPWPSMKAQKNVKESVECPTRSYLISGEFENASDVHM